MFECDVTQINFKTVLSWLKNIICLPFQRAAETKQTFGWTPLK